MSGIVSETTTSALLGTAFTAQHFSASDVDLFFASSAPSEKPALLLLHGYPQTHCMWHGVAAGLSTHFHVIAPDLRGYGDSGKPETTTDHGSYAKRAMASDLVELMTHLGHQRFHVAGHDRGARVAHRLCLDHPERVRSVALLDIVPTLYAFEQVDQLMATAYYHWFFLQQPAPFPERLIGNDPETFLHQCLRTWSVANQSAFHPQALQEYLRCFRNPDTIRATCEDYRAAATIDLVHDRADRDARIRCPLLVLWGARGFVGRQYDVEEIWRARSQGPITAASLDCGHFLVEERPQEVSRALLEFFQGSAALP